MAKNEKIKIKLVRSLISTPQKHIKIVKSLGLTKLNSVVEHEKSDVIMGMVNKIPHLVEIV